MKFNTAALKFPHKLALYRMLSPNEQRWFLSRINRIERQKLVAAIAQLQVQK